MAWINKEGERVNAMQFGHGQNVAGQTQEWDKEGCYYTVTVEGRKYRLKKGDWVSSDENGRPTGVMSDGRWLREHRNDPTVPTRAEDAALAAPAPVIVMSTEDYEAADSREKLIADAPKADLPPGSPKKKGGRPKGSKNKVKPVAPKDDPPAADDLVEV